MRIEFRLLVESDLPMLHAWLNEPGVIQWWEGQDVSWEGVVRNYGGPTLDSREQWLAMVGNRAVGWLQCYLAADNLDETEVWWEHGIDQRAAGIDYLLADPQERGRGVGSRMIRAFAEEVVLGHHPEWPQVCAGPFAANVASCRALEKAGFRCVAVIDDEEGPCRLMVFDPSMDPAVSAMATQVTE
ncbi:MAG: GNAT family N-acetyltransferase [Acidimicrobiales bacterium]